MDDRPAPVVGAPLVEAVAPPPGTPAGRFHAWLERNRASVGEVLVLLTERWRPYGSFVEVNFIDPDVGPAGAIVMNTETIDVSGARQRLRRVMVIPFAELELYLPTWREGGTVLTRVEDMPERLARRYAATAMRWSLNVPIRIEGEWVGLIGAATGSAGFSSEAVASFEASARLLIRDYAADDAWRRFRETVVASDRTGVRPARLAAE